MFGLVMPERVAEEVVKRDVKMIFDPVTNELIEVVMPFMSRSEVMTLSVDQVGLPVPRSRMSNCFPVCTGKCFVLKPAIGSLVRSCSTCRPVARNSLSTAATSSGGVIRSVKDSPYWKRLNDSMLKLLPDADAEMRAAGLDGRWFLSRVLASSAVTTKVPFCDRTRWILRCLQRFQHLRRHFTAWHSKQSSHHELSQSTGRQLLAPVGSMSFVCQTQCGSRG